MKILALEKTVPGARDEAIAPRLEAEAARVWELYQAGIIRETYFRRDWPGAVLILECTDAGEARTVLATLPLVSSGLIDFDVIELEPYPGFSRLFAAGRQP